MSITDAKSFAIAAHDNQKYGKHPYSKHLLDVVSVLTRFHVWSTPVLEAAWLHDVLEDTHMPYVAIRDHFGPEVAAIVNAVTDGPGANRKERHIAMYHKIRRHGVNAVLVKLADRIANTEHSIANESPQLKMYRREFAEFSTALFASGECDAMWDYPRKISTE
jgi:(p)ppGpp synthase/HD superfamily hydrolase